MLKHQKLQRNQRIIRAAERRQRFGQPKRTFVQKKSK